MVSLCQIYDGPLEDYFSGNFGDVLTSYKLYDGSGKPGGGMGKASEPVGTMKAIIGAYPALSSDGQPPVQSIAERVLAMPPIECVVRVYVIRVSVVNATPSECSSALLTLSASSACVRPIT